MFPEFFFLQKMPYPLFPSRANTCYCLLYSDPELLRTLQEALGTGSSRSSSSSSSSSSSDGTVDDDVHQAASDDDTSFFAAFDGNEISSGGDGRPNSDDGDSETSVQASDGFSAGSPPHPVCNAQQSEKKVSGTTGTSGTAQHSPARHVLGDHRHLPATIRRTGERPTYGDAVAGSPEDSDDGGAGEDTEGVERSQRGPDGDVTKSTFRSLWGVMRQAEEIHRDGGRTPRAKSVAGVPTMNQPAVQAAHTSLLLGAGAAALCLLVTAWWSLRLYSATSG